MLSYPPVTETLLSEIVRRVLSVGEPVKVLMFGSRACGTHKRDSDLDIMIIETSDILRDERRSEYLRVLNGIFPELTILIYSTLDVEKWKYVSNHIITTALSHGKVLFESKVCKPDTNDLVGGANVVSESIEYKTVHDMVRDWLGKADQDVGHCQRLLEGKWGYERVCFHAQQAVEKHLKSFLALQGLPYEKTNDLNGLLSKCTRFVSMPELAGLDLQVLSSYAVAIWSDVDFSPSREIAENALSLALRVIGVVQAHLPEQVKADEDSAKT